MEQSSPVVDGIHLSERLRSLWPDGESPFNLLHARARALDGVISLGIGDPDHPTPPHVVAAAKAALDADLRRYTPIAGLPELRDAISDKLARENGLPYRGSDEIIVTSGAQEAIAVVMQSLLDQGDEVLTPSPYYFAYVTNTLLAGGRLVDVPTDEAGGFQPRIEDVESRITPRSRVLVFSTSGNPTGVTLTEETIVGLADVVRRHDLVVVTDEIYERIHFGGPRVPSIASLPGMRERTILIGGLSKAYSMTGFRVGYLAGPASFCSQAVEAHHAFAIAAPTASQYAAVAALTGPQEHVAEVCAAYADRHAYVRGRLASVGISVPDTAGSFWMFPSIRPTGLDSMGFCLRALEEERLLVFPGSMYGPAGEGHVRLSLLAPREVLAEALDRFCSVYLKEVAA